MLRYIRHWFGKHDFTQAVKMAPNTTYMNWGVTFATGPRSAEVKVCRVCNMASMAVRESLQ